MKNRPNAWRSLLLLLLLAAGSAASAQQKQTHQSFNYGFVSPNTSENLKLEQAIDGLNSPEEIQLKRKAINLSCVARSQVRAFKALGSWSDGAEHSIVLRVKSDEPTVRYLLSRLGRDARQKYVLYFHHHPLGSATLYTLRPRKPARDFAALASALDRAGIVFRTLVPANGTTAVYIVDLKRDLRRKVFAAARRLRARVKYETGNAAFFGYDNPDQARVVFEQEIRNYETRHPNLPPACDAQKRGIRKTVLWLHGPGKLSSR